MATAALRAEVSRLRARVQALKARRSPLLSRIRRDPAGALTLAGLAPDPWQAAVLRSTCPRLLVLA